MKKFKILNLVIDGKKYSIGNISGNNFKEVVKNGLYHAIKSKRIKTDFARNLLVNYNNLKDGWLFIEDDVENSKPVEKKSEQLEMTFEEFFWKNHKHLNENVEQVLEPVYHVSKEDFQDFDMERASPTAIFGKGIYFSFKKGDWKATNQHTIEKEYSLKGNFINLFNPTDLELEKYNEAFSNLLNRPVDHFPIVSLEKRFGSVAEGVKAAGFDGIIHEFANKKHVVVYNKSCIIKHGK